MALVLQMKEQGLRGIFTLAFYRSATMGDRSRGSLCEGLKIFLCRVPSRSQIHLLQSSPHESTNDVQNKF